MTLTVRLPQPLEEKLEAYCADAEVSKSHVVQECLAAFLVNRVVHGPDEKRPQASAAYTAFKRAGLVGAVDLGTASATRDVVRERMAQRLGRKG